MIGSAILALTHLDTDRVVITRLRTGVPSRLIHGQILHHHELIHREMPAAVRERPIAQRERMLHSRRTRRVISRAVDRNKRRPHPLGSTALQRIRRDDTRTDINLTRHLSHRPRQNRPGNRLKLNRPGRPQIRIGALSLASKHHSRKHQRKDSNNSKAETHGRILPLHCIFGKLKTRLLEHSRKENPPRHKPQQQTPPPSHLPETAAPQQHPGNNIPAQVILGGETRPPGAETAKRPRPATAQTSGAREPPRGGALPREQTQRRTYGIGNWLLNAVTSARNSS